MVFLLFLFVGRVLAQQEIHLIDKHCQSSGSCPCTSHLFSCDKNISLVYFGDHTRPIDDRNINCLSTAIHIYDCTLSIDSVYYLHNRNRRIKYMFALVDGQYEISGKHVQITMKCKNLLVNSNSPSSFHVYDISYNVETRKVEKVKYTPLYDKTSPH